MRFKARRCATLPDVQAWVEEEQARQRTDRQGIVRTTTERGSPNRSVSVPVRPCLYLPPAAWAANAALSLLNLASHLLDRQLAAQARDFETRGGFTERLYRVRADKRNRPGT